MHKTERILSISFELAKVPKLIIWSFSHLETLTGAWQENEVGGLFQLRALSWPSAPRLLALWLIHHFFIRIDQVYQMINGLNWSSLGFDGWALTIMHCLWLSNTNTQIHKYKHKCLPWCIASGSPSSPGRVSRTPASSWKKMHLGSSSLIHIC